MTIRLIKNITLISLLLLVLATTLLLINYRTNIHDTNKNLFYKTIYQDAKTNFENIKIIRVLNSMYSDVYIKSSTEKANISDHPNNLYTNKGEALIKIDSEWMKDRVFQIMNNKTNFAYKITSLNPLNPVNAPNEFEKKGLNFFERSEKDYYFENDKKNKVFNFIGKLKVETTCLTCHGSQGYKLGEIRGGISVSIPALLYESNLKQLESSYKLEVFLLIITGIIIYLVGWVLVNKIYKNQKNLNNLKDEYKLLYDRYDYAVSGAKLGLWDWNLLTNEIYFSKEWKNMLGYEECDFENKLDFWDKNIHPDDKEKAYKDILANQNKETKYYENIHRLKHKDGSWVWILDKGRTVFDSKGKAIRMIGFHTNITKIQNLEVELGKLKKVIEHSPISIVIANIHGNIEYVNPHFCETTGYTFDEAMGANPRLLKSEYTSSLEYKDLWTTITNKKTWTGRFKNKAKDGTEFWESAIIMPILDESNNIINFLAIKQEITKEIYLKEEIRNKEEMMIAQSRHAAMGEMISMIAHQWRQPISVVAMACNNILIDIELELLDTEQLKENLESMLEQTKYLSQTIEDFRDFFKPNKEKEIINPSLIVDETLSIMSKSLENNNINVIFNKKENFRVHIYSRELLQVFLNIIKNAKESFQDKNIKNKIIEISIKKMNKMIRIEFYDNAGSIDDKIKDKIFDPYFSTKDEKTGTGLGLYMSKTIIEKHLNGELGFFNINDGVSFYVDLYIYGEE
jgi:PAS domain S-box-containing protein